jgi:hypothetical protein
LNIITLTALQDPIQGNYCPVNSTKPNTLCADGYYCPNVTAQIQCPQGYYCRQQVGSMDRRVIHADPVPVTCGAPPASRCVCSGLKK